ncbi:hypothetical protein UCDDS831_g02982 [Diplodia seriata]|uniref:Uncharacterized protein n=1 Tax=Diplodia seriata TaxID=420778 RepID=A0A0G2EM64_9PEZI|nr:hypothetical protein UCDDS831_g02982 [Diplodia seriata]
MISSLGPASEVPGWVVNQDSTARKICVAGLTLSLVLSIICLFSGIATRTYEEPWTISVPANTKYLIPLAVNGIITLSTECLGFIHNTSLKWALLADGSLEYNANLRLFTFAKRSWPNGRIFNFTYLLALSVCFAATPAIIHEESEDDRVFFVTSGAAFIYLGLALLAMTSISFWSFPYSDDVPTWSSNPLNFAAAVTALDPGFRNEGRCMHPVHEDRHTAPLAPKEEQKSAYDAHPQVATILWAEYAVFTAIIVWASLVFFFSKTQASAGSWSFIPKDCSELANGSCYAPHVVLGFLSHSISRFEDAYIWMQVPFSIFIQSIITIGLHCAELLVTVSRDEMQAWRAVATAKGSNTSRTSAIFAFFGWETLALTLMKPFVHWIYGMAVFMGDKGLLMLCPQLVYLAAAWAVFLVFVTYISFRKPKGPLPATYGHLQTLADLVDEWYETMFWGHKGESEDGICHAGTSDKPLPQVRMDALYKG